MRSRLNSIPDDFWEITLSRILLRRRLDLVEGSVSVPVSPLLEGASKRLGRLIHRLGPGLNLAQTSVWLTCAMSLAVFNIEKYVDESGNVVEPEINYSNGTIR